MVNCYIVSPKNVCQPLQKVLYRSVQKVLAVLEFLKCNFQVFCFVFHTIKSFLIVLCLFYTCGFVFTSATLGHRIISIRNQFLLYERKSINSEADTTCT